MRGAEELMLSGKTLPASELHALGVVDIVAKDGEGKQAVRDWIIKTSRRRSGTQAIFSSRQQVNPLVRKELDAISELWVDAALRLEARDLKAIRRIVRLQGSE